MTFEEFKQQIDDLEERRRIARQAIEERTNGCVKTVSCGVIDVFSTLKPYINYCTEACGLTGKEKCIAYAERPGFEMKILWTDDWLSSKIEINCSRPPIEIKTSYKDLYTGSLRDLNQLNILQAVFKAETREKLVDELTKNLYYRIMEKKIYV